MPDRIRELNDYLDRMRTDLRAALDLVPAVMQDQAPAPGQWSAAGVVEHLALAERRIAGVLRSRIEAARIEAARIEAARIEAARIEAARIEAARIEAARIEAARSEAARSEAARTDGAAPPSPAAPTPFDWNAIVDRTTRRTASAPVQPTGLDTHAAWAELEHAGNAVRDALSAGADLPLDTIQHPHPALGTLSLYQWVEFVGAHEARHAAQLREIAAALAPARV